MVFEILLANANMRSLYAGVLALVKSQISPLATRLPGVNGEFANSIQFGIRLDSR